MRTRNIDWHNKKTNETLLGIEVSKDGVDWFTFRANGKIYYAKTEDEREIKKYQLRKNKFTYY